MQNSWTDLKGLNTPMKKLTVSVTEVMVMETAASLNVCPILSGTDFVTEVLRQAASMTKVSSIPIPKISYKKLYYIKLKVLFAHLQYYSCDFGIFHVKKNLLTLFFFLFTYIFSPWPLHHLFLWRKESVEAKYLEWFF